MKTLLPKQQQPSQAASPGRLALRRRFAAAANSALLVFLGLVLAVDPLQADPRDHASHSRGKSVHHASGSSSKHAKATQHLRGNHRRGKTHGGPTLTAASNATDSFLKNCAATELCEAMRSGGRKKTKIIDLKSFAIESAPDFLQPLEQQEEEAQFYATYNQATHRPQVEVPLVGGSGEPPEE